MFKLFNALTQPLIDLGNATSSLTAMAARSAAIMNGKHEIESAAEVALLQKQLSAIPENELAAAREFLKSM